MSVVEDICTLVKKAVDGLPTNKVKAAGEYVKPNVFMGYTPPIDKNSDNHTPCAIVRYISDQTDSKGNSTAKVKIVCVAYSEDVQEGWNELLMLMDVIRTFFMENRNINKKNRIIMPIKRTIPEEQSAPFWGGEIELNIEMPTIQEVDRHVRGFLDGGYIHND